LAVVTVPKLLFVTVKLLAGGLLKFTRLNALNESTRNSRFERRGR
jgi:hypothetical protein